MIYHKGAFCKLQYQEIYWKSEIFTNFLVPQFSWQLSRNHDLLKRNICQVSGKADGDKKFEWGSLFKRSCPKWHLYFAVSICSKILAEVSSRARSIYLLLKQSFWKNQQNLGLSIFLINPAGKQANLGTVYLICSVFLYNRQQNKLFPHHCWTF